MKKEVTVIDYGAGNVRSLTYALERLGARVHLSSDRAEISEAERIIFPGVGHADQAMNRLREKKLDDFLASLSQPFLGICLGMQLLFEETEEGQTKGLGIMKGTVARFSGKEKVPHMGWNLLEPISASSLLTGLPEKAYAYFVHSYFAPISGSTLIKTKYGGSFAAAVEKQNFYGCQFHPEKSGITGDIILKNFLNL